MALTVEVLRRGRVDYGTWSALLGSWAPIVMHARLAFCIFERVHIFTAQLALRPGHSVRIPPASHDEMLLMVAVAPMCHADLRAPVSPEAN